VFHFGSGPMFHFQPIPNVHYDIGPTYSQCQCFGWEDLRNRKVLSLEWKNDGVMDDKSGNDDTREVR